MMAQNSPELNSAKVDKSLSTLPDNNEDLALISQQCQGKLDNEDSRNDAYSIKEFSTRIGEIPRTSNISLDSSDLQEQGHTDSLNTNKNTTEKYLDDDIPDVTMDSNSHGSNERVDTNEVGKVLYGHCSKSYKNIDISSMESEPQINVEDNINETQRKSANADDAEKISAGPAQQKKTVLRRLRTWRAKSEPRESWLMLLLSILPIYIVTGMEFVSFSMYYVEYAVYFTDTSMSVIGVIPALRMTAMCLFGLVSSALVDTFGARAVSMAGGATMFVAFSLSVFAPNIYMLYATQGILLGFSSTLSTMGPGFITQKMFSRNRAMATSLSMCGISLGNMLGPPCVNLLIQAYGWRGSLAIQAAISAHIIPFSALMSLLQRRKKRPQRDIQDGNIDSPRSKPKCGHNDENELLNDETTEVTEDDIAKVAQGTRSEKNKYYVHIKKFTGNVFDFSLFKHVAFTLICVSGICDRFCTQIFIEHVPNRAIYLGMSRTDGATFMSVASLSVLSGRILMSFLSNLKMVNRVLLFAVGSIYGGLDGFFIVIFGSYIGQIIASVLMGTHVAITNTIMNVVLVELVGLMNLARAMALYNMSVSLATMTAAPLAGYLYDVTKSYDPPFLLAGSVGVFGGMWGIASTVVHGRTKRLHKDTAAAMELDIGQQGI